MPFLLCTYRQESTTVQIPYHQVSLNCGNQKNNQTPGTYDFTDFFMYLQCRIIRISRRTLHREPVILKPEWASLVLQMTCGTYLLHTWLNGWIWGWRYPLGVDRHGDGVVVDCCDVVNAWSFPFFLTGVLSEKVFLGMAGHLSWCSCDHNIPWDAPPITLAKFFQSKKK